MSDAFPLHLALANLGMAHKLVGLETDKDRKETKSRIAQKKAEVIYEAFAEATVDLAGPASAWQALPRSWKKKDARRLLLELLFCEPFAPYEVKVKDSHRREALLEMASRLGLEKSELERLEKTRKSAQKAHSHVAWGRIAVLGLGGLLVHHDVQRQLNVVLNPVGKVANFDSTFGGKLKLLRIEPFGQFQHDSGNRIRRRIKARRNRRKRH